MILTPLKIQVAIIKAWYSIALKSVKYYAGLAVGINNSCLLKQARLLRKYVEILKNFTIVDSTIECSCCIEGDYTVLLNDLSETTEANIQFGCDTEGYMLFNGVGYPFTYYYDEPNSKVFLKFTTLINPSTELPYELNLEDVAFNNNCDFTTSTLSPIEEATIEPIENEPVINNEWGNWDGNISIYEPNGTTLLVAPENPLPISVDIINNPELIVDEWNTDGVPGWLLIYSNNQFTMLTPFDGTNYVNYIVEFNQYEGGVDSIITNTTFIPQSFVPVGTRASKEFDIPNTFVGSVQAQGLILPSPPQPFITTGTRSFVNLNILKNTFSTIQQSATMTIDLKGSAVFGATTQFFYYNGTLMFSHVGAYADPAALVTDFNNNNGQGFTMTYVGPSSTPGRFSFEIESPINGESYNGNDITVAYSALISPLPDSAIFSGGISTKPSSISITDTFGLNYNYVSPLFSNINDFILDFDANNGLGYDAILFSSNVLFDVVRIYAPLSNINNWIYNGTQLTFVTTDPNINLTPTYSGGIDTTECQYSLDLYDALGNFITSIVNGVDTNYSSLADIAADINSNVTNTGFGPYNSSFETSVVSNQMSIKYPSQTTLPNSLICSTYNGYYFILNITYASPQYLSSAYSSDQSFINNGIDAVSNQFEISDTANGILLLRALDSYNYPNGSEIENGLIPDFNTNILGYTAEFMGAGTTIPSQPSISTNFFISQLTAATISNGEEIRAYIDNVYIGKYQAPVTGVLPSYNQMILNLTNDIIVNTSTLGIGVSSVPPLSPTTITLVSPTGQEVAYNGKQFIINKIVYTPSTISITFGSAGPNTIFNLRANLTTICTYNQAAPTPGTGVAILVESLINSSGTNYSATRVGATVTISSPPFTGSSLNGSFLLLKVDQGSIVVNSTTYNPFPVFIFITSFSGGLTTSSLIKQEPFAGGVNQILTTKIKVLTPIQPSGVGNWAFNSEFLSYNYNLGEYIFNGVYSGGVDTTVGSLTVEILDPALNVYYTLYTDGTPQNYLSRQSLVNIFNAANPLPVNFQISLLNSSSLATFLSPTDSFSFFNDFKFRYSYNYVSDQYSDYIDITTTFDDGVDPTLTSYEGIFQVGDIGTFVNDNPCEATIAEQECLSNKQVSNIIQHINKLVR